MARPRTRQHPNPSSLEAFALGRLEAAEAERVEEHLEGCPACTLLVQEAPEDDMVRLLRRSQPVTGGSASPGNFEKPSRSPKR